MSISARFPALCLRASECARVSARALAACKCREWGTAVAGNSGGRARDTRERLPRCAGAAKSVEAPRERAARQSSTDARGGHNVATAEWLAQHQHAKDQVGHKLHTAATQSQPAPAQLPTASHAPPYLPIASRSDCAAKFRATRFRQSPRPNTAMPSSHSWTPRCRERCESRMSTCVHECRLNVESANMRIRA